MSRLAKLELLDVVKSYGPKRAVQCDHLAVQRGEFLTLLGPSGSGKTTLLSLIAGFTEPTSGKVLIDGKDVSALPPEKRNLGMMFQGYALFPHLSVGGNVAFPLRVRRRAKAEIARLVAGSEAQVRLNGLSDRLPRQLSGGQQQRVALARASVFDPELLLLDEPLSALDRKLRVEMQAEIKHAHAMLGKTFIYVTHDQDEALSLSDRIVILHDGEVAQVGTPQELYERPASRFVASFLGQSNFISGDVIERRNGSVVYRAGEHRFVHEGPAPQGPGPLLLSLRPENIRFTGKQDDQQTPNRVNGTVTSRSYFGSNVSYLIDTQEFGSMMVSSSGTGWHIDDAAGREVALCWSSTATVNVSES